MNHSKDEEYIQLPKSSFGDIYRGMTVLKRVEVHYYQIDENNSSQESKDMTLLRIFFIRILINFEYSLIRYAKNFSKHKM
jgi:hypothetical protein